MSAGTSVMTFFGIFEMFCGLLLVIAGVLMAIFRGTYARIHFGIGTGLLAMIVGGVVFFAARNRNMTMLRIVHILIGIACALSVLLAAAFWTNGMLIDSMTTQNYKYMDPDWCKDDCCDTCDDNSLDTNTYWTEWNSWYEPKNQKDTLSCSSDKWISNCHPNMPAVFTAVLAICATIVLLVCLLCSMCTTCCVMGGCLSDNNKVSRTPQHSEVLILNHYPTPGTQPGFVRRPEPLFPDTPLGSRPATAHLRDSDYMPTDMELSWRKHPPPSPARPAPIQDSFGYMGGHPHVPSQQSSSTSIIVLGDY